MMCGICSKLTRKGDIVVGLLSLLRLRETHNALQLLMFFSYFSFFCQPIGVFGVKKYFADHRTANTIQLFVSKKGHFLGLFFYRASRSEEEFQRGYFNKYSHLFICRSLKQTSSGRKPVYTINIFISEQIAFAAVLYLGQVFAFCRLINKSLGWFLLIHLFL